MVRTSLPNLVIAVILCFIGLSLFLAIHFFTDWVHGRFEDRQEQVQGDAFIAPQPGK